MHARSNPPAFLGVFLLLLGGVFLLDTLDVVNARTVIRTYWPALLVAWGGAHLVTGQRGERFVAGLAFAGGSILLANRVFGWGVNVWNLLWPTILIATGIHILYRAIAPGRHRFPVSGVTMPPPLTDDPGGMRSDGEAQVDASSTLKAYAVLGHVKRANVSQAFRGGEITAMMGGVEIDLRDCRMAGQDAVIELAVTMGGVELRIPREWAVDSRLALIMAGLDDRSAPPVDGSAKRLVLEGKAMLGGVEIRN
jgi:hypothetical protein